MRYLLRRNHKISPETQCFTESGTKSPVQANILIYKINVCKIQQQLTADGRKESEFLFKKMSLKDICFAFVGPCWEKQSPNSKQPYLAIIVTSPSIVANFAG